MSFSQSAPLLAPARSGEHEGLEVRVRETCVATGAISLPARLMPCAVVYYRQLHHSILTPSLFFLFLLHWPSRSFDFQPYRQSPFDDDHH